MEIRKLQFTSAQGIPEVFRPVAYFVGYLVEACLVTSYSIDLKTNPFFRMRIGVTVFLWTTSSWRMERHLPLLVMRLNSEYQKI